MNPTFELTATETMSSAITVGDGAVLTSVRAAEPGTRTLIVTDAHVAHHYRAALERVFTGADILVLPAGEAHKTLTGAEAIYAALLGGAYARGDTLAAVGGGVITDMGGFAAGTYKRGMRYQAIPTTLLGMVDAAIGGKTGVDHGGVKNMVGTTYFPERILIDPGFLDTLPDRELATGLAEVIKYGATLDASLLDDLDGLTLAQLRADKPRLLSLIKKSVACKVKVVQEDPREKGIRKVLNFGHTFGHAIEAASDYSLTHGEAIAIGITLANRVAQRLGKQEKTHGDRVETLLQAFGLPTTLPEGMDLPALGGLLKQDKKAAGGSIHFILSTGAGQVEIIQKTVEELIGLAD